MKCARNNSSALKRAAALAACVLALCCVAIVASETDAADGSVEVTGFDETLGAEGETLTVSSDTTIGDAVYDAIVVGSGAVLTITGDVTANGVTVNGELTVEEGATLTVTDGTISVSGTLTIYGTLDASDENTAVTVAKGGFLEDRGTLAVYDLTVNGVLHNHVPYVGSYIYNYGTIVFDSTDATCGPSCGGLSIYQSAADATVEIRSITIGCASQCAGECFIITITDETDEANSLRLRVPSGITFKGLTVSGNELSGDIAVSGEVAEWDNDTYVYDTLDDGTKATFTVFGEWYITGTLSFDEYTRVTLAESATVDATGALSTYHLTVNGVIHHHIYNYGKVVFDTTESTCGFTCGSLTVHQAAEDAVVEFRTITIDCWNQCGGECFIITVTDDGDDSLRIRVPNGITLEGLTVDGDAISGDVTVSGTVSSEAYNYEAAEYDTLDDGIKATFTVFGVWNDNGFSTDDNTKLTIADGAELNGDSDGGSSSIWWIVAVVIVIVVIAAAAVYLHSKKKTS